MGKIICSRYAQNYPEEEIGWWIWDLLSYPLPVLALRKLNDPPLWKDNLKLQRAISLTCRLIDDYQPYRGLATSQKEELITSLEDKLPEIVLAFQKEASELCVRSISAMRPSDPEYSDLVMSMARAVHQIASLRKVDNPMLGSKAMHFLFPEFFPVWDTAWVKKKCLVSENVKSFGKAKKEFHVGAGSEYADYVNLMVTDLAKTDDYEGARRVCIQRSWIDEKIISWHYEDITPTVFEICLLGKHVGS